MTLEQKYLLEIIKSVLNENASLTAPPENIDWTNNLSEIASRHSVANIVSYGLENQKIRRNKVIIFDKRVWSGKRRAAGE